VAPLAEQPDSGVTRSWRRFQLVMVTKEELRMRRHVAIGPACRRVCPEHAGRFVGPVTGVVAILTHNMKYIL